MILKYSKNSFVSIKYLLSTFFFICMIIILFGCTSSMKISYTPIYTEKRAMLEDKINKQKTILVLPYNDNRGSSIDPYLVCNTGFRVKLVDQTLSEYLFNALSKDLKLIGFNVIESSKNEYNFKDFKSKKIILEDHIDLVLAVDINKLIVEVPVGFASQPVNIYDFNLIVFDNKKKEVIYNDNFHREILGEKITIQSSIEKPTTPEYFILRLLNDDLSIINIEIAEILILK